MKYQGPIISASLLLALIGILILKEREMACRPATVIERQHIPSSTGVVVTSGKTGVVFNPEKWEIVVRDDHGNVYSVSVSAETWMQSKPGVRINDNPERQ
jgi:hypothetical protein